MTEPMRSCGYCHTELPETHISGGALGPKCPHFPLEDASRMKQQVQTLHIPLDRQSLKLYRALARATESRRNTVEFYLRRTYYPYDDEHEWTAHVTNSLILPPRVEWVVYGEGPMDAIHNLKAALRQTGVTMPLVITNIERTVYQLDD